MVVRSGTVCCGTDRVLSVDRHHCGTLKSEQYPVALTNELRNRTAVPGTIALVLFSQRVDMLQQARSYRLLSALMCPPHLTFASMPSGKDTVVRTHT